MKIQFEKKDLITFGNYLLSKEREAAIGKKNEGNETDFEREYYKVNQDDFNTWFKEALTSEGVKISMQSIWEG